MTNITSATAKFTAQVVRVHRKRSRTVRVTLALAQNIIAAERELRIQTAVKADEQLFLMHLATGLELIDFSSARNRPRPARVGGFGERLQEQARDDSPFDLLSEEV